MQKPKIPLNEVERQSALDSYNIINSLPEQSFDDLTLIASQICNTPIALVSLIDKDRQWFKSKVGLDANETHRDISFCGHAINEPNKLFEIKDAKQDKRFIDNPLVAGDLNIGFYAGVPLVDSSNLALGTLCVIDHKPRSLSKSQKTAMKALARQVINQIESRNENLSLNSKIQKRNIELESEVEKRTSELQFSKERLELALSGAQDGILDWTNINSEQLYWSPRLNEILGYNNEDLEQKISVFLNKLLHPADFKNTSEKINNCLKKDVPFNMEFRLKTKKESYIWFRGRGRGIKDSDGKIYRMTGSITDIDIRKKLELKLFETQNFLQKITDIAPSLIYVFNLKTMSNEFMNKEMGAILGYSNKEIQDFGDQITPSLCHPDDLTNVLNHLTLVSKLEDNETATSEYRMKHKDGEYRWFLSKDAIFERDNKKNVLKMIGIAIDITKLKNTQVKLSKQTKVLQSQNEELKQLAYVATHDLKSPMITLEGHFNYLKNKFEDPTEEIKESIEFIEEEIKNFTITLKGLNEAITVKEVDIEKKHVDINAIIHQLLPSFKSQIEGLNGALKVELDNDPQIKGNVPYVQSIIHNLMSNAIKYRSPNTSLIISIKTKVIENYLKLTIEDNGLGMDLILQKDKLFKMFNQFHHHSEGSGMGLFLVKKMVEKLEGKINIISKVDKGTTVDVLLKRNK